MEELFNNILDKDEQIVKVFKPNKLKMFFSMFFKWFWCWIWFLLVLLLEVFVPGTDDGDNAVNTSWEAVAAFGVIIAVLIIINIICFVLEYKKTFYAYTNKRVVIRRGIIGVDYKSLDMSMIGAVTVNVTLLDKIVHKNTGTIVFGSMASPMQQNNFMFRFANITTPYEVYKEIKSVIDDFKNKSTTSVATTTEEARDKKVATKKAKSKEVVAEQKSEVTKQEAKASEGEVKKTRAKKTTKKDVE